MLHGPLMLAPEEMVLFALLLLVTISYRANRLPRPEKCDVIGNRDDKGESNVFLRQDRPLTLLI